MITITYSLGDANEKELQEIIATPHSTIQWPDLRTGIFIENVFFRNGVVYPTARKKSLYQTPMEAKSCKYQLDEYHRRLMNALRILDDRCEQVSEEQISTLLSKIGDMNSPHIGNWVLWDEHFSSIFPDINNDSRYSHHRNIYDFLLEYTLSSQLEKHAFQVHDVYTRRMLRFELYQRMIKGKDGFNLCVDTITTKDLIELKDYCINEYLLFQSHPEEMAVISDAVEKLMPRAVASKLCASGSSIHIDMLNRIKAVLNWLRDTKHEICHAPFIGMEIGMHTGRAFPVVINEEEQQKLLSCDLTRTPTFDVLRDIFVFQCRTGIRFRDIQTLTKDNIGDGDILQYQPKMILDEPYPVSPYVKLDEICKSIIAKQEKHTYDNELFTSCSYLSHGSKLKAIFKKAGLSRLVYRYDYLHKRIVWSPLWEIASTKLATTTFHFKNCPSLSPLQDGSLSKKQIEKLINEEN